MAIDLVPIPAALEFTVRDVGRDPAVVSITERSGGHEDRVIDRRWQPLRVTGDVLSQDHAAAAAIADFFVALVGSAHAFLFRNCFDFAAVDAVLGTGDGVTDTFDLVRDYSNGARVYQHPILYPDPDTIVVTVNGTPVSAVYVGGAGSGSGQVELASPPAGGTLVQASFEFDVPMRLAAGWPGWHYASTAEYVATALQLIEVRS